MKKTLLEEIERIHRITYEKEIISEQNFLSSLLNKIGIKKVDEPTKADFVSPDINEFYRTLQETSNNGGLKQQPSGSMSYQKGVESMQIALTFLGYELPKYGVDGLYGPETAVAVDRFKKDNNMASDNTIATPEMLNLLIKKLQQSNITSENLKKYIDATPANSGNITNLDLSTPEGVAKYAEISQRFINSRQPNPLNITGEMLAKGAKGAFDRFGKYVPPELALSQLALEGGIGNGNINSRPIRTKNPFNVGNVDSGANVYSNNVQASINNYFNLIARNYISGNKSASDLLQNFTNKDGKRYASAGDYEAKLNAIAGQVNKISNTDV